MQLPIATWSTRIGPMAGTVSHAVRAVRLGGQRFEAVQVDASGFVINGVRIGLQRSETSVPRPWAARKARVTSSLGKMEVVAPSSAPILVMVARSGTLRLRDARAGVLDDLADAALDGQPAQHLEDDVLGADPGLQLAGQLDADAFSAWSGNKGRRPWPPPRPGRRRRSPACRCRRRSAYGCPSPAASCPGTPKRSRWT